MAATIVTVEMASTRRLVDHTTRLAAVPIAVAIERQLEEKLAKVDQATDVVAVPRRLGAATSALGQDIGRRGRRPRP